MSIIALACTHPAHAQWATTSYPNSGTLTYGSKPAVPWNASSYYGLSVGPKAENGSIFLSGSVSAILQWQGRGTAPPTNQQQMLPVLITVGVGASDSSNSDSGGSTFAVSDGYGDAQVPDTMAVNNYYNGGVMSYGKHLVQVPVSQGAGGIWQATVPATSLSGSATSAGLAEAVSAEYTAQADTRAVSISSNLGQTYSRPGMIPTGGWLQAVPVPNPTQGVLVYTDTVAPDAIGSLITIPTISISYSATPVGNWTSNSTYLWNFGMIGNSANGTFQPSSIGSVSNTYANPPAVPGQQEHAYIHLTDAGDGANATANYYVRFHDQVENWGQIDSVQYPAPIVSLDAPGPGWVAYTSYTNYDPLGTAPETPTFTLSSSISNSITGIISVTGTTTLSADEVSEAFEKNESITLGTTYTAGSATSAPIVCPPGGTTYIFWAYAYTENISTCAIYGTDGYEGDVPNYSKVPNIGPDGGPGLRWGNYFVPKD